MARSDPSETVYRICDIAGELDRRPARIDPVPRSRSALPDDAVAVIEPCERSVTQGGRAGAAGWRLRFLPRGPRFADPSTGWTGSADPLAHVALRFPDRASALRFVRRHGLPYQVRAPAPPARRRSVRSPAGPLQLCCWPTGPHALCCGNYPLKEMHDDPNARQ